MPAQALTIAIGDSRQVSGLLQVPPRTRACYVFAHGAGAGMKHAFMKALADELAKLEVATLRYQFPYMEAGSKRPDAPALAHATVRAAVDEASRRLPEVALFAGGKSFGGRMTSQTQAASPLPGVRGLVFVGFPLHAAGKPSSDRATHLLHVEIPMLFLQGTRDQLADGTLMRKLAAELGPRASLAMFQDADHSFHVPARSGRTDAQVQSGVALAVSDWIRNLA
jgi:hypothetical protein